MSWRIALGKDIFRHRGHEGTQEETQQAGNITGHTNNDARAFPLIQKQKGNNK